MELFILFCLQIARSREKQLEDLHRKTEEKLREANNESLQVRIHHWC